MKEGRGKGNKHDNWQQMKVNYMYNFKGEKYMSAPTC
jgi:hypothetical protein